MHPHRLGLTRPVETPDKLRVKLQRIEHIDYGKMPSTMLQIESVSRRLRVDQHHLVSAAVPAFLHASLPIHHDSFGKGFAQPRQGALKPVGNQQRLVQRLLDQRS